MFFLELFNLQAVRYKLTFARAKESAANHSIFRIGFDDKFSFEKYEYFDEETVRHFCQFDLDV